MKIVIVTFLISALLLQIGCSSIAQIPYPIDESKSDSEIRSLNYFGERLSSTIYLADSVAVEAYWLNLRDDKIYFLTDGAADTASIEVIKIKTVKYNDWFGGCIKGSWLGLGLTGLATLLLYISTSTPSEAGYTVLVGGTALTVLSTVIGILFLGQREFNFTNSVMLTKWRNER